MSKDKSNEMVWEIPRIDDAETLEPMLIRLDLIKIYH